MIIPSYPDHPFRKRNHDDNAEIYCEIRKRWVRFTPEEWVRQNTYQWLVQNLAYPKQMISIEKGIRVVDMAKRYDLLVYNSDFKPWMLIECKAQSVPLSEDTLMQVLRYNIAIPVPYLLITNGDRVVTMAKTTGGLQALDSMPAWE